MKRYMAALCVLMMVLTLLSGCGNLLGSPETTQEPAPTQSPEEQAVLKILTIGNSHSIDSTQMLHEVFKNEMPEQKVVLGTLYYSGCPMDRHAKHINENTPAYIYYKNSEGYWEEYPNTTIEIALNQEQWDYVVMQQMNNSAATENGYVSADWMTVIDHVLENQKIAPKFVYNMVWSNPDNYDLYLKDGAPLNGMDAKGISNWRNNLEKNFANAEGKYDHSAMYQKLTEYTKKYLADTTDFLGKNYFEFIIPAGTAVEYAQNVLNRPQTELYRDYTHLNDYSRVMAAYLWYAQIMGLESVDAVNMNEIPDRLHHPKSEYPSVGNMKLDDKMKSDIIAAVNWALKNPFSIS